MTRDQAVQLYDQLYDAASDVLARSNPCDIRRDDDGNVSCLGTRSGHMSNYHGQLCCDGCRHLGPSGCTTQSLMCRTWTCPDAAMVDHVSEDLFYLRRAARMSLGQPALFFRGSKEDFLAAYGR